MDCHFESICESCTFFVTIIEFRPTLKAISVRSYTYVADMVEGIVTLMQSDLEGPANIGRPEYVTVAELFDAVVQASGKNVTPKYVEGPLGVQSRNFSHARIESLGWSAPTTLRQGIGYTYNWIEQRVRQAAEVSSPA